MERRELEVEFTAARLTSHAVFPASCPVLRRNEVTGILRRAKRALIGALVLLAPLEAVAVEVLPEAPRALVDTTYVPPTGVSRDAPDTAAFAAALAAALPGDEIVLRAGVTYQGPFTLQPKNGTGWITIRTNLIAQLPVGRRVIPADAAKMPKIVGGGSPNTAIRTSGAAHHYRFIGIEFMPAPGTQQVTGLISFGSGNETSTSQLPHHLIIDRSYVHGHSGAAARRGLALNSAHTAIIDSHFSEWKTVGEDSQAIAGWNGSGPYKIVNNYLEAAAENVAFGGADPGIANLVPSDIEIRGNHFFKPLAWRGSSWTVKNLLELKSAQRVVVDGNVFENSWPAAQSGVAIVFTVRNQDGGAPWSTLADIAFTNNWVMNAADAMTLTGADMRTGGGVVPTAGTHRILIENNVFEDLGAFNGQGRLFIILWGPNDVVIRHNTGFPKGNVLALEAGAQKAVGFHFQHNITSHGGSGVHNNGREVGSAALTANFTDYAVANNVVIGGAPANYATGNHFPGTVASVGFVAHAAGDYRLTPTSPYKNAAPGPSDIGADIDALEAALVGVPPTTPPPTTPPPPTTQPPTGGSTPPPSGGTQPTTGPENVVWASAVKVTVNANTITKSSGCDGCADAGAVSQQTIASGSGSVEFKVSANAYLTVGLSNGNPGTTGNEIKYALRFAPGSIVEVRESGVYKADWRSVAGALYKIAVEGGVVKYYENGALKYTSTQPAAYPLLVDAAIGTTGAGVQNAVIARPGGTPSPPTGGTAPPPTGGTTPPPPTGGTPPPSEPTPPLPTGGTTTGPQNVTWTSPVKVAVNANSISKTSGCDGCADAGAASQQTIAAGNGAVEFKASANAYLSVGLSNGNPGTTGNEIKYALRLSPGSIEVRESGVYKADWPHVAGAVYKIAVEGGVVKYYQNGVVKYTSGQAPVYPLLLDTMIGTVGAGVQNAVIIK